VTQTGFAPVDAWSPDDGVGRVLVVTAHPDDVDFGAAGSIAAFRAAGVEVAYCVVTNGEAGGSDRAMPRSEMAAIRQREQRAAAAVVGVDDLTFLGHPDGALNPSIELRRDITRVIRQFRPQRVITQSPDRLWDSIYASHPDHLAAGEAAVCAVYPDARNPFAHPELLAEEGLEPHSVAEIWLMASSGSTRAVDITDTFDVKMSALRCHESQGTDSEETVERIRAWGAANAQGAGWPPGRLAELFRVVLTG
jgi:LmbE family N-acetylglucosaminyl deacetylase